MIYSDIEDTIADTKSISGACFLMQGESCWDGWQETVNG